MYVEYKKFGFSPIATKTDKKAIDALPADLKSFLDEVWGVYGKFDAAYLEELSHSEAPWQTAREGVEPHIGSEKEISHESMRAFYSAKLQEVKK